MADYPLVTVDDLTPVGELLSTDAFLPFRDVVARRATLSELLAFVKANVDVPDSVQAILEESVEGYAYALIFAAAPKTSLSDADVIGLADSDEDGNTKVVSIVDLIGSIFKTTRTIANARFDATTFRVQNSSGQSLIFDTEALGAARTVTFPNAAVDLGRVNNVLGYDQTWQTPTRAAGTTYQNTTGRPIQVNCFLGASTNVFEVSADNLTWVSVGNGIAAAYGTMAQVVIPSGWYYRASSGSTISKWVELR